MVYPLSLDRLVNDIYHMISDIRNSGFSVKRLATTLGDEAKESRAGLLA